MDSEGKLEIPELKVPGFRASGVRAGIKKNGNKDMALIVSDVPAVAAVLFTTNKVKAAPVLLGIETLRKAKAIRAIAVNSGNANACTGKAGYKNAAETASLVEKAAGLPSGSVLVSSTGVIGVPLPMEKLRAGIPEAVEALSYDGLSSAVEAIMTTDAFPKTASTRIRIGSKTVTLTGIAKGAGMICPNMATMLCYILTDANIKGAALKKALKEATDLSFNSIIVDNDTSTNDTIAALANGVSGSAEIKSGTPNFKKFQNALNEITGKLARMIVMDGEGATRLIEINVKGARNSAEAAKAARTVGESYLVKSAFFGGDPNWGRIMAALGRSGIKIDEGKTDIVFNEVPVVRRGLDTGMEKEAAEAIKTKEVKVTIDLRSGKHSRSVWTSDLTYEYVKINSAYRT